MTKLGKIPNSAQLDFTVQNLIQLGPNQDKFAVPSGIQLLEATQIHFWHRCSHKRI